MSKLADRRVWLALPLVCALGSAGCQCQPTLPSTDTTVSPPDLDPTGSTGATADTAAPPRCSYPEVEPNDVAGDATPLGFEVRGCGTIASPLDQDVFSFEVLQATWLLVEVAKDDGSTLDPALQLNGPDVSVRKDDDVETTDASLVFPALPGPYTLAASSEDFTQAGERFTYEVLVSEAKEPVESTRTEGEPNDAIEAAEVVVDGDAVFGTMQGNGALPDFDWYAIAVPTGRHVLTLDIEAYDYGSSADLTIFLYNDALDNLPLGCNQCAFRGGQIAGVELDPLAEYDSAGAEVVYIQVLGANGSDSPTGWYVLDISMEAL